MFGVVFFPIADQEVELTAIGALTASKRIIVETKSVTMALNTD